MSRAAIRERFERRSVRTVGSKPETFTPEVLYIHARKV